MPSLFTAAEFGLPDHATCPFCAGTRTELHSPFGSQLAVATYWCLQCYTAFEYMKRHRPTHSPAAPPEPSTSPDGMPLR